MSNNAMQDLTTDQLQQIITAQDPLNLNGADPLPSHERKMVEPVLRKATAMLQQSNARHEVIIGPRRTGKTTLLKHLYLRLLEHPGIDPDKLVFLSLDELVFKGRSLNEILDVLVRLTEANHDSKLFLLADEIAHTDNWDLCLKNIHDFANRFPVNLIATSSSALELNRGSIESGADRWNPTYLFPCQIQEYCHVSWNAKPQLELEGETLSEILASVAALPAGTQTAQSDRRALENFMALGGFPQVSELGAAQDSEPHLLKYYENIRNVIGQIIRNDIYVNLKDSNFDSMNRLFEELSHHPAGMIAANSLKDDIGASGYLLDKYFNCLEDAMVTFRLSNYAGPKKSRKSYFYSNAIPAAYTYQNMGTMLLAEKGWALENMVAVALFELTRHSISRCRAFHWREGEHEVDFVFRERASAADSLMAIEVGSSHKHHIAGLQRLVQTHPELEGNAYLVTPDGKIGDRNGIKTLPLFEFLLAVERRKDILVGLN